MSDTTPSATSETPDFIVPMPRWRFLNATLASAGGSERTVTATWTRRSPPRWALPRGFCGDSSYDTLGDTIGVTQQSQAGSEINTSGTDNDVASKGVALGYNDDGNLAGEKFYASTDIASTDTANLVATVTDSYDYDQNLTGLTYVAQASGATLAAYTYAYNTAGLQTSMTYSSNTIAWNENDAYSYDPDGQLLGTTYNVGQTGGEVGTSTYETTTGDSQAYDPNGNRTSTDSTAESSATNRLLYDGTYYYNYDAEGNRTAKFISTSGALDSSATDITIYTWNNDNELTSATHYADWSARITARIRPTGRSSTATTPLGGWSPGRRPLPPAKPRPPQRISFTTGKTSR